MRRHSFDVGETILVAASGAAPATLHEFHLERIDPGQRPGMLVPLATLTTDRHGDLAPTVLLPFFGLLRTDAREAAPLRTFDEARKALGLASFVVHARAKGREPREAQIRFALDPRSARPHIACCDERGRLLTAVTRGEQEIYASLRNFRPGCVKLFLVARQFRWNAGDPIDPPPGYREPPTAIARVPAEGNALVRILAREQAEAGRYQVIARSFVPGWFEADADYLLPTDIVANPRTTSLVVRPPRELGGVTDNDVLLTPQIAGRPLAHAPYFRFANNFPRGTDVWAAIDPDAVPPGLLSQRATIYVIRHKSPAAWAASKSLGDISGPGMSAQAKTVAIVPGCVNWNETLVWPNPQVPGKYDVVVDFGNNAADPAAFVSDASLDSPLDMVDGYVRVGFHVTEDPSLPGPFAATIGQHAYDLGSISVPSTDQGSSSVDFIPVRATVRYPAQAAGVDAAMAAGAFPLIVVMHGNSSVPTSYLGYDYLLDHLASHGFIAASIHVPPGVFIETRARAILHHLGVMAQKNAQPGLFQGHVDLARIGIAGHSRGGEAVVRAARINTAESLGWHLKCAVSIAPTDYFHYGDPGVPILVIYGANDGDVSGEWPNRTGFVIYDEAGRPRSHVFVYGATHDRFNSQWAAVEGTVELKLDIAPSDIPKLISETDHQNVARGYVAAFMQLHVQGKAEQVDYFTGELRPILAGGLQIHTSHQEPGAMQLDNFEQSNPAQNTLGGNVAASLASSPDEASLHTLDAHSPHVTSGGRLSWATAAATYRSTLPAANKDVTGYEVLAFRVTQKYGSLLNAAGMAQNFRVRLSDSNGKSRAVRVSTFTDIPFPYERGYAIRIKSALKSVRIPLSAYAIANLGVEDVDLRNLASVSFEFSATASGEIEVDDIEFSH